MSHWDHFSRYDIHSYRPVGSAASTARSATPLPRLAFRPYFPATAGSVRVSQTATEPLAPPAATRNGDSGQKAALNRAPTFRSWLDIATGCPVVMLQSFTCSEGRASGVLIRILDVGRRV